jgi:putative ABC transport system permease protein
MRTVKIARAVHRALLVLVPRGVRRVYRAEMVATFEAASAEAGARGRLAVLRLLLSEIKDLASAHRANQPVRLRPGVPGILRPAGPAALPAPASRGGSGRTSGTEWLRASAWRQAWRSLARRPAFATAAVVTLAFGTGITTAAFSLVDSVLIKPLPYPDADRLIAVYESSPSARNKTSLLAPGRLEDWRRLSRSLDALSGSYSENVTDTSGNEPERLEARRVAPGFFTVYAMPPLAGRPFLDAEEAPNGPGAAVISERFWARRFHRDSGAIGHALIIGGRRYEIVGVVPVTFTSARTDVWLPAQVSPWLMRQREARFLVGVGRLRPGISLEAAARDLAGVQDALAREFPQTDAGWSAEVRSLKEVQVGGSRRGLVLVFGAVALLWVVAIANIAGLTLVQLHRRARELAIRTALGASRTRVIGAVIREGLLVALMSGALGAGLAAWLVSMMPAVLSKTPRIDEVALDWRALAFTAATSLLAACIVGLIPAMAGTRSPLNGTTAGGSRTVAAGRHQLQKVLVVGQVATSLLLVGSATLLLRSYYNLTHVETGFDASETMTFHVGARWDEDRTRIGRLQEQLVARLQELPHVRAAGLTNFLPATGATLRYQVRVDGLTGPNADGSITVGTRMISGGYFAAIRAPLVAGSFCAAPTTSTGAPLTALLNQRFVDVHAPNQNLVGRTLRMTQGASPGYAIVGVVGNLAEDGHASSPAPYVYTCNPAGAWPDPEYVARTVDFRAFAADLRRIVRELDSSRAVFGLRPLQDVLDGALDQPRMDATMLGLFAGAAVTLAAIGLYSLFMLVVSERAREMAVRLAIGAAPGQMFALVMAGAGRLLAGGIVLGLALTVAADRVLRGVLFGVSHLDAPVLAAAALTLAIVSAIAVAGPALKASRIAPIDALRGD